DEPPEHDCQARRFTKEPGFLLLSKPHKDTSHADDADLLLIYLVGETPTSGIQKQALITALDEIAAYCGWKGGNAFPGPISETCGTGKEQVRILGPSFSGSAQSIDIALARWIESLGDLKRTIKIKLISGSATAIKLPTEGSDNSFPRIASALQSH